ATRAPAPRWSPFQQRRERVGTMLRERLWRKFEDSVRGSVPSEKAWRRKGRQLTILLASAVAGSWGARAAAGCASAAGGAGAWQGAILGGLEMSGKKYAVAVILGAMILGGGLLFISGRGGRSASELAGRRGADPSLASAPVRAEAAGASSAVDAAGAATVKDL